MKVSESIIALHSRIDSASLPNELEDIFLYNDLIELKDLVKRLGFEVLMKTKSCKSGRERISKVKNNLFQLSLLRGKNFF